MNNNAIVLLFFLIQYGRTNVGLVHFNLSNLIRDHVGGAEPAWIAWMALRLCEELFYLL